MSDDLERSVTDAAAEYGRRVRLSTTWLYVDNTELPLPDHGWKLHISARPAQFARMAELVVPVLLAAGCHFKMARSPDVLRTLNTGDGLGAAAVGKAWTVYPPLSEIRQLGMRLAELLRGESAPRVLSDRQVAADAPVYYRYGPFRQQLVAEANGKLDMQMTGPDGEVFDGQAQLRYRQPPWAVDPFRADDNSGLVDILGGRYRPTDGLQVSGRGNVYRAEDVRTGQIVIVKQARAHVCETDEGHDARIRLRNERYVLEALTGTAGVPRYLDHFRHGADEYLVTSFDGKFNLAQDVPRNGRYRPLPELARTSDSTERTLDRLATRLARILRDIHARGFVVADLSPKNIVIRQSNGRPTIIDFGLCNHDQVRFLGGTPAYAPHAQLTGVPPTPTDDLYALGMTLLYAATGADPVVSADDPEAGRRSALQTLRRIYGAQPPPSIRCVAGLLDADRAETALAALCAGHPEMFRAPALAPADIDCEPVELVDHLRADLIDRVGRLLDEPGGWPDANPYQGAAGVGLELLHHLDHADAAETVRRLAASAADWAQRSRVPLGLFIGATGVEVFLRRVREAGLRSTGLPDDLILPSPSRQPEGDDIVAGAAGVGLGHCLLAEQPSTPAGERERHRAVAGDCAHRLLEHTRTETLYPPDDLPPAAGLDASVGLAHGQAGIVAFLLHAARLGIVPGDHPALRARLTLLYEATRSLVDRSGHARAVPLCVSWCRGLAGIGTVLVQAAHARGDDAALDLAVAAGTVCTEWIPYLAHPGACCGISGVGDFLLRLAEATGADRFTEAAFSAAEQLVIRGITEKPRIDAAGSVNPATLASWASGRAGTLGFLRRLHGAPPPVIGPF
ncbi:hypothetical protein NDR87_16185 [Nocardia sp. CDC159]|uniref:non-specific serine/threonine protein kinase n=1 Tax=Nocardia pulmonis TaxID=2951408 RepID=A0A9X2E763_9NOCA|nr:MULTISPECIES: lanthionine synthetase LanC family protein [Nocardia]MCM6775367.1 hypothetical protein [Nocardia pulmonis]MCM6787899.1 hypothetical protein [Nocardia sp. CDC159]